ncbi:YjcZ family sporulation protein [Bacillus mycoides]|uniref:YjcZ family sporulation protein n=1 Tax=Bacillus mycoides TaxID=1405 RepID=UPI003F4E1185
MVRFLFGVKDLMKTLVRFILMIKYEYKFLLLLKGKIYMGYGNSCYGDCGFDGGFSLLFVLFILLIIVGTISS